MYRPIRSKARDRRRASTCFVGRVPELSKLREAVEELASRGAGGVIVVEGTGIGKSTVLAQVRRQARTFTFRYVRAPVTNRSRRRPTSDGAGACRGSLELPAFRRTRRSSAVSKSSRSRVPGAGPLFLERGRATRSSRERTTRLLEGQSRAGTDDTTAHRSSHLSFIGRRCAAGLVGGRASFEQQAWHVELPDGRRGLPNVLVVIAARPFGDGPSSAAARMLATATVQRLYLGELGEGEIEELLVHQLGISSIPGGRGIHRGQGRRTPPLRRGAGVHPARPWINPYRERRVHRRTGRHAQHRGAPPHAARNYHESRRPDDASPADDLESRERDRHHVSPSAAQ